MIQYDPLVQPALIKHAVPQSDESRETIAAARFVAARINMGKDDRLLVIVGPCSIHSPDLAKSYAEKLLEIMPKMDNLCLIMRAYL